MTIRIRNRYYVSKARRAIKRRIDAQHRAEQFGTGPLFQ